MFSGVNLHSTLLQAHCLLSGFMACGWREGVHPATLMPLCRADKAQECSFPQGDMLMCPFFVLRGGGDCFPLGLFMRTISVG